MRPAEGLFRKSAARATGIIAAAARRAERKGFTWHVQPRATEQPEATVHAASSLLSINAERRQSTRSETSLSTRSTWRSPDVVEETGVGPTAHHRPVFKHDRAARWRVERSAQRVSTVGHAAATGCRRRSLPPTARSAAARRASPRSTRLRQEGNRPQGLGQEGCRTARHTARKSPTKKAAAKRASTR